jgi:hypothetical protein
VFPGLNIDNEQLKAAVASCNARLLSQADGSFTIEALDSNSMQQARAIFIQEIHERLMEKENELQPPDEWERTGQQLCLVAPGGEEYKTVTDNFFSGGFKAMVIKVERVENENQWSSYAEQRRSVKAENNNNANERWLKHGTRNIKPDEIIDDYVGLDMRFGNKGMYGVALYFAETAEYSNKYASTLSNGHKQMFLVRIIAGNEQHVPQHNSHIKRPDKGYHSVRGNVGGPGDAYMLYDNHRAYPAYLITYSENK